MLKKGLAVTIMILLAAIPTVAAVEYSPLETQICSISGSNSQISDTFIVTSPRWALSWVVTSSWFNLDLCSLDGTVLFNAHLGPLNYSFNTFEYKMSLPPGTYYFNITTVAREDIESKYVIAAKEWLPMPTATPSPTVTPTIVPSTTPTQHNNQPVNTDPPAPTPTVPELSPTIVIAILACSLIIAVVLKKRA